MVFAERRNNWAVSTTVRFPGFGHAEFLPSTFFALHQVFQMHVQHVRFQGRPPTLEVDGKIILFVENFDKGLL